jgi:hypothetical protein
MGLLARRNCRRWMIWLLSAVSARLLNAGNLEIYEFSNSISTLVLQCLSPLLIFWYSIYGNEMAVCTLRVLASWMLIQFVGYPPLSTVNRTHAVISDSLSLCTELQRSFYPTNQSTMTKHALITKQTRPPQGWKLIFWSHVFHRCRNWIIRQQLFHFFSSNVRLRLRFFLTHTWRYINVTSPR